MDISPAVTKIADIVTKINEYKTAIEGTYNNYASKINGYIDEISTITEKLNNIGPNAVIWVEIKLKKVLKKISDTVSTLTKKIEALLLQIKTWYDNIISKVKTSVIQSTFAKMGVSLSADAASGMSDLIPSPDVTSLMPEIKIELPLPNITDISLLDNIKLDLPKLPLL
jgi:hypothetical protein